MFLSLPGVSVPLPFGGSARSIIIRANPDRLRAFGLSPEDVIGALTKENTISPSGNVRLGDSYPSVPDDINVAFEFDQSPCVTRAITSLTTEGFLGALLTGV